MSSWFGRLAAVAVLGAVVEMGCNLSFAPGSESCPGFDGEIDSMPACPSGTVLQCAKYCQNDTNRREGKDCSCVPCTPTLCWNWRPSVDGGDASADTGADAAPFDASTPDVEVHDAAGDGG